MQNLFLWVSNWSALNSEHVRSLWDHLLPSGDCAVIMQLNVYNFCYYALTVSHFRLITYL
jgi:hypothetical protein